MINIKKSWQLYRRNQKIWPEGEAGLERISHREMVGGMWNEIGSLQFDYLLKMGLKKNHTLLDIGCGCFRAGRYFIEYLDASNYIGLDKEVALMDVGVNKELPQALVKSKSPKLIVSDSFDFSDVSKAPEFALAQSLFTHLTLKDIGVCLKNLAKVSDVNTRFFCTIFETENKLVYLDGSHSGKNFEYTQEQMRIVGAESGWRMNFIGDWAHPRDQKMIEYTLE